MKFDELVKKYGLTGQGVRWGSCVGDGWVNVLLDELVLKLVNMGWNKNIAQVKEKFGGLRFYIEQGTREMTALIDEYESRSFTVCEECGAQARMCQTESGWYKTYCEVCAKEHGCTVCKRKSG